MIQILYRYNQQYHNNVTQLHVQGLKVISLSTKHNLWKNVGLPLLQPSRQGRI